MTKQRLDLVKDTLFWLVRIILDGQESLKITYMYNQCYWVHCVKKQVWTQVLSGDYKRQKAHGKYAYLWKARLHIELLKHSIHVACGSTVLQPNET